MSIFKKQFSRALRVYPSDDINIPFPNLVAQGQSTSLGTDLLIDSNADFISQGIQVGDTVYFDGTNGYANVVSVDSATTLTLSIDIINGPGQYSIYQGTNQGCYIYVEAEFTARLVVYPLNNPQEPITFNAFPSGQILPVQVLKISTATNGADGFIALWP